MTVRFNLLSFVLLAFLFITAGMPVFAEETVVTPSAPDQSSEYQIGPENALQIDVYYGKNEKLSQKVRVSSRGVINFPLVGEVAVTGLTVSQLQEKLKRLLEKDYLVNPQVTVFIEEYSTVSIMGEVKKPGAYPIRGRLTVVGLISQAEGFSENASPNEVKVIRTNPEGIQQENIVRVHDIMSKNAGDNEGLVLRSGDVVNVPKSTVTIAGEVKKPGAYPTKERLTVIELISMAEGFSENASPNEVKVMRTNPDGTKQESLVRVQDIMNKNSGDNEGLVLRSGDVVNVPKSTVSIMGEVKKPGAYPTKGRLTVIELISLAEGFSESASPNEVKVIRTHPDGTKQESIVQVQDIMNKNSGDNEGLLLCTGDVVIVPESTVTIMGEVNKPGAYPTKGRLTVIELIALAEGFSKIASPNKVKVIHTNPDGTKQESIVRVRDIMNKKSGDNESLVLRAGDVVIVPESLF